MADLQYSLDALNARNAFLGVKAIVYVEGDDDTRFWHEVFSQVADKDFEIEAVGGADRLDEYIQKIVDGDLEAIAARDADFMRFLGKAVANPKVVFTRGYSIENSLYETEALAHAARNWCKTNKITTAECAQWLNEFAREVTPLVHLDLANALSCASVATIGENCTRFMTSTTSATVCSTKVAIHAQQVEQLLPSRKIGAARRAIGTGSDDVLLSLRGHFLASAAIKFIVTKAKRLQRRVNVSADSLYAVALAHFGRTIGKSHPHKDHYLDAARAAWAAL